jgi:hypothetical protein
MNYSPVNSPRQFAYSVLINGDAIYIHAFFLIIILLGEIDQKIIEKPPFFLQYSYIYFYYGLSFLPKFWFMLHIIESMYCSNPVLFLEQSGSSRNH